VPLYGDIPPVAETVIVEEPPLQRIGVEETVTRIDEFDTVSSNISVRQPFTAVYVPLILYDCPLALHI
jgi:hypothetical protein